MNSGNKYNEFHKVRLEPIKALVLPICILIDWIYLEKVNQWVARIHASNLNKTIYLSMK